MNGRSDDDDEDELEWLKWLSCVDEMKQEADSRDGMMQNEMSDW